MTSTLACSHFPACSGCTSIGVAYGLQLERKLSSVRASFDDASLKTASSESVRSIIPSPLQHGYRNRVKLVPRREGRAVHLGLFRSGTHEVVDISDCPVQTSAINQTVEAIRAAIRAVPIEIYNELDHRGDLRFVTVREGVRTGELLVGLVVRQSSCRLAVELGDAILERCPDVVGVVQNTSPSRGNAIFGRENHLLCGQAYIEEIVCDVRIRLGITSFFQVNTQVAEKAYEAIVNQLAGVGAGGATGESVLIDLYAGVGTIGLIAAGRMQHVYAIETMSEAVEHGRASAEIHRLDHVDFRLGTTEECLPSLIDQLRTRRGASTPIVAAVNPPRRGLTEKALAGLVDLAANRIAYLSCAPWTLLRDLVGLEAAGYGVEHIELFDMFPQTEQVETLVILDRK